VVRRPKFAHLTPPESNNMMKHSIGAACATALVALAGGLVTPTASHAAVYGGVFDPENANYKWFGNHVFTVADACLLSDGWKRVNDIEYGCGSASLSGGDLTVVAKRGTPSPLDDVSKTLQFADFPSFIPSTSRVWGVNIVGGQLVGVDTFEIGDFTFTDPGTTHQGDWQLRWTSGNGDYCDLYFCIPERPQAGAPGAEISNTMRGARPDVILTSDFLGPTALPQGATLTFQRLDVPEPATFTLVMAALGAGWLTRRRNKR
jgi:hypothetical protein